MDVEKVAQELYNQRLNNFNWERAIIKLRDCGGYFGDLMDLLLARYISLKEYRLVDTDNEARIDNLLDEIAELQAKINKDSF